MLVCVCHVRPDDSPVLSGPDDAQDGSRGDQGGGGYLRKIAERVCDWDVGGLAPLADTRTSDATAVQDDDSEEQEEDDEEQDGDEREQDGDRHARREDGSSHAHEHLSQVVRQLADLRVS